MLNERSDTENFLYEIKVVANNFKGDSLPSNAVQVMAMHPVTVTFVDRITRTGELTEGKLEEVKERINEHEKNDKEIENNDSREGRKKACSFSDEIENQTTPVNQQL